MDSFIFTVSYSYIPLETRIDDEGEYGHASTSACDGTLRKRFFRDNFVIFFVVD